MGLDVEKLKENARRLQEGAAPTNAPRTLRGTSPNEGEEPNALAQFGASAVRSLIQGIPGVNTSVNAVRRAQRGEELGVIERTGVGIAQGLTFGSLGRIASADEALASVEAGEQPRPVEERRSDNQETARENSGLLGELIGAIAPGGPGRLAGEAAERGLRAIGQRTGIRYGINNTISGVAARTANSAVAGGALTYAYSRNMGLSHDQALKDSAQGALGAGGLSIAADGARLLGRLIKPYVYGRPQKEIAERMREVLRTNYGEEVITKFDDEEIIDIDLLANRGHVDLDADTLYEAMPDTLKGDIDRLLRAAVDKEGNVSLYRAAKPLNDYLVNMYRSAMPAFKSSVEEAFGTPQARSTQELIVAGRQLRTELAPQYEAAFRNVSDAWRYPNGRPKPTNVKATNALIDRAFRGSEKFSDANAAKLALKLLMKQYTKRGARNRPTELTARQLKMYIQAIDGYLYDGKFPSMEGLPDGASFDRRIMREYLVPARDNLRQRLYEMVPDVQALDMQYSDEVRMRGAHEAGRLAVSQRGNNSDAYDVFSTMRQRSPAEQAAFAEGVKSEIMRALADKSPQQAQKYLSANSDRLDLVQAVLGQDAVVQLRQAVGRYTMMTELSKRSTEQGVGILQRKDPMGFLADAAILAGGVTNQLSTAAAAGAGRRQLVRGPALSPGYTGQQEALSRLALQRPQTALSDINNILMQQQPRNVQGAFPLMPGIFSGEQE